MRNPKSELRDPKEGRNPKVEGAAGWSLVKPFGGPEAGVTRYKGQRADVPVRREVRTRRRSAWFASYLTYGTLLRTRMSARRKQGAAFGFRIWRWSALEYSENPHS